MTIIVSTEKVNRVRVLTDTEETEPELELLLTRGKKPYSDGWVEVHSGSNDHRHFVPYNAVTQIEVTPE
jgi:hypothetical protein